MKFDNHIIASPLLAISFLLLRSGSLVHAEDDTLLALDAVGSVELPWEDAAPASWVDHAVDSAHRNLFIDISRRFCEIDLFPFCVCSEEQLIEAVNDASTSADEETLIHICAGSKIRFHGPIDLTGKHVRFTCRRPDQCTFAGRGENQLFIGAPIRVTFWWVLLQYGWTNSDDGGMIHFTGGTSVFRNNRIWYGESVNGTGGAIAIEGKGTKLIMSGALVTYNSAKNGAGVSVKNGATAEIMRSSFQQNDATDKTSGAIHVASGGSVTLTYVLCGNNKPSVLSIADDEDPNNGVSYVDCSAGNLASTFCEGEDAIVQTGNLNDNTNCGTTGKFTSDDVRCFLLPRPRGD